MLELDSESVVAGAIVGAEERNIGRVGGKRKTGNKFVAAVLVDGLLMFIGDAEAPSFGPAGGEIVFEGGAGLKCVRRAVIGIDERALASVGAAGKTGGICQIVRDARIDGLIDSGESIDPTVLREIVVIETDSSAKNGVLRCAGSVSETEARGERFAVIGRNAVHE